MMRLILATVLTIVVIFVGQAQQNKSYGVQSLDDSIKSINLKARDYRNSGKYDSAFILSKQALRLSEDNRNYLGMASALNIIGTALEFTGKYDSALIMNNKALKICHENKLDSIKAIVCNSLGTAYKRVGKYGNSIDAYYTALEIEEKNSNSAGIWRVLGNLTSLYKDLGDYQKSLETGLRSIHFAEQDSAKLLRSFINVGVSFFNLKNETKAIEYTLKALEISTITKSKDNEIICNINLGEYYLSLKSIDKARYYIKRAYTESMAISSKPRILSSSINYTALMVEIRKYDSAIFFINKANSMIKFSNDKQKKVELHELKAKVYAGKSNFKLAYQYADSARLLTAELKNEDVIKAINNSISSYEVVKKENE
ncbi:MAG: tetratricopeptide repeat protein, partial [Chryseotalea sp.]